MLTPIEIENKEFKRSIRGFNENEVDDFLDLVKEDFETLYRENIDLKERIRLYQDQISKYENIEDTLNATLITAQKAAEDTCNTANKKAQIIVEEADLRAKQTIDQANNRVVDIRREYEELVKEFKVFRNKFKSLVEDEARNIDQIFSDIDEREVDEFETVIYHMDESREVATTLE